MEKPVFIEHSVMRLPPGYRFHPTDEELVVQYLKRKVLSCPLPASVIPEIDLRKFEPWDLPGVFEGERYFFNLREAKYRTGDRPNRATSSGYWKATGKDKPVRASGCKLLVGMKKVLVYYLGKPPYGSRTDWIMHEYRLAGPENEASSISHQRWNSNSNHGSMVQTKNWVACRIFKKKRASKIDAENPHFIMQQDGDLGPPSPSSSSSSCVTELSEESSDGDEGSSSTIASSPSA